MFGIPSILYPTVVQGVVFGLCLVIVLTYGVSKDNSNLLRRWPVISMAVFGFLLIIFMGLRPASGRGLGDTVNYSWTYNHLVNLSYEIDFGKEWIFDCYTVFCKSMGLSVHVYFLGIEIGYIGCLLAACKKLLWESTWVAMLFCTSAYSFFTYGVNGLRNGLACSIIILAASFVAKNKNYFVSFILAFIALGIHRSVMLPIITCLGACVLLRNPKIALRIWLAAIPISLVLGGSAASFFASLGFDDRMDKYSVINLNESFSSTGFRWDFLLYSAMPVLLTWYVHKRVDETGGYKADGSTALADANSMRVFNILSGTYILANSFWILVINANFSNRFAYLSWFLYPFVIAYGFIRLHLWNDQDRKCAWALLLHAGFTFGMFMIGKL